MDADRSGGYNCIEKWLMVVQGSGELLEIEMVEGFTCVNHNGVGSWQSSDLDGGCCS